MSPWSCASSNHRRILPLIKSGSQFNHLVFVQHGTIVPWQYPYSELAAPYLIGEHEFLSGSGRWVASYSAATEAIVVDIPVGVMKFTLERVPQVRDRMHELVMRRLACFYWTSLATTGTPGLAGGGGAGITARPGGG